MRGARLEERQQIEVLPDLDELSLANVAHQDDGQVNFVPGLTLWDDAGHLSVTTPVCTYSQQSFVPSSLVTTFVGLMPNPAV